MSFAMNDNVLLEALGFDTGEIWHREYRAPSTLARWPKRFKAFFHVVNIVRDLHQLNPTLGYCFEHENQRHEGHFVFPEMGADTHSLVAVTRGEPHYLFPRDLVDKLLKQQHFEPWYVESLSLGLLPCIYRREKDQPAVYVAFFPISAIPGPLLGHPPFAEVLEDLGGFPHG